MADAYTRLRQATPGTAGGAYERINALTDSAEAISSRTGDRTAALEDAFSIQRWTGAGAATYTLPANASVAFPIGTNLTVMQSGAGQVTIAGAGGVTVNVVSGRIATTLGQHSIVQVIKLSANVWMAFGGLAAA